MDDLLAGLGQEVRSGTLHGPSEDEQVASRVDGRAHPLAEVFPLLKGEEYRQLRDSVEDFGLLHPVSVTPEGVILDGRNRWKACRDLANARSEEPLPHRARVRYRVEHLDAEQQVEFILARNLRRRHQSISQRAMMAAGVRKFPHFGSLSQAERGRLFSVSRETVQFADAVLDSGDETLAARVEVGRVAVSKAAKDLRRAKAPAKPPEPTTAPQQEPEDLAPESQSLSEWLDEAIIPSDPDPEPQLPQPDTLDLAEPESPLRRRREPRDEPLQTTPAPHTPSVEEQGPQPTWEALVPVLVEQATASDRAETRTLAHRDEVLAVLALLAGLRLDPEEWLLVMKRAGRHVPPVDARSWALGR